MDPIAIAESDAACCARESAVDVAHLFGMVDLSERESSVVLARVQDDSFRDIAEELGVGVGSVSWIYESAMLKLRAAAGLCRPKAKRAAATSVDAAEKRIIDLLRARGPMQGPEIREALGIKKSLAWNALNTLRVGGAVVMNGTGRSAVYELVEAKEEAA